MISSLYDKLIIAIISRKFECLKYEQLIFLVMIQVVLVQKHV